MLSFTMLQPGPDTFDISVPRWNHLLWYFMQSAHLRKAAEFVVNKEIHDQ